MGVEHCADVQHCRPTLFADVSGRYCFRQAWKAQRARIEVLADSGQKKTDRAKRIAVIKDTTAFKAWDVQTLSKGGVERCLQVLVNEAVARAPLDEMHLNLERPVSLRLRFLDVCTGQHPDQLSLAEFVALKARDVLFHIDMDVGARNTVVVDANKWANCVVEDEEEPEGEAPKIEFEDVGGAWNDEVDVIGEDEVLCKRCLAGDKIYDWAVIETLLCRQSEIKATEAAGRHADAHTNMGAYASTFGPKLQGCGKTRLERERVLAK